MNNNSFKKIEETIDSFSKILAFLFKLGLFFGGSCLLFYCYRLQYFPIGISLGDGLLLIFLATSFGLVYGMFSICLISLGLFFTPVINCLKSLVSCIYFKIKKKKIKTTFDLFKPNFISTIFSLFGLIIVSVIYQRDSSAIPNIIATCFILCILFSAYTDASKKINLLKKTENEQVIRPYENKNIKPNSKELLQTTKIFSAIFILISPLVFGGISGLLIEFSMAFSGVKKGTSYVMVKEPYSSLIPKKLSNDKLPTIPQYITFDEIDVLFSGFGQKTIVEFKNDNKTQRLEIPNESIFIMKKPIESKQQ